MKIDLTHLAERLTQAAQRVEGLDVTISSFDLIISKDGYGAGRSESVPFAALFLSDQDLLGEALDRLDVPAAKPPRVAAQA